jgi:hypothetical protein
MNTSREEIQLKPMTDAIVRSTPEPAIGGGNDISEGRIFWVLRFFEI